MLQVLIDDDIAGVLNTNLTNHQRTLRLAFVNERSLEDCMSSSYDETIDLKTGISEVEFDIKQRSLQLKIPNARLQSLNGRVSFFDQNEPMAQKAKALAIQEMRRSGVPEFAQSEVNYNVIDDCYMVIARWNCVQVGPEEGELLFDLDAFEPV